MKATRVLNAVVLLAVLSGVSACTRRDETMGPAQKAGQAVDQAVIGANNRVADEVQDNLKKADEVKRDAAQSVKEATDRIQDTAKETTDRIQDTAKDASRGLSKATEDVGKKVERAGEKIQESARPK